MLNAVPLPSTSRRLVTKMMEAREVDPLELERPANLDVEKDDPILRLDDFVFLSSERKCWLIRTGDIWFLEACWRSNANPSAPGSGSHPTHAAGVRAQAGQLHIFSGHTRLYYQPDPRETNTSLGLLSRALHTPKWKGSPRLRQTKLSVPQIASSIARVGISWQAVTGRDSNRCRLAGGSNGTRALANQPTRRAFFGLSALKRLILVF